MRISKKHQKLYQQYYREQVIEIKPHQWAEEIDYLCWLVGASTVLDYGCGAHPKLAASLSRDVISYDPGVEGFTEKPSKCDVVACCDVLEHVEPDCIDAVIEHIHSRALKAIFLVVSCQESESKVLPDGSPWHSFVKSQEWWQNRLPDYRVRPCRNDEFVGVWVRD